MVGPTGLADLPDCLPAAAYHQPHLAARDADHLSHLLALDPGLLSSYRKRMHQGVVVRPTASDTRNTAATTTHLGHELYHSY